MGGGAPKAEQQQQQQVEDAKKRRRDYHREYYHRRGKQEYNQRPDVRARKAKYNREWRQKNPDKIAANIRKKQEWRRLNPDKASAENRHWAIKRYGITVEQYEQFLIDQNGVCALCGQPPTKKRLNVDHDHNTGRIRGLLCHHCNIALGRVERMMSLSAIESYLQGGH